MKTLILLSLILLTGCFPGQGGYVTVFDSGDGATEPEDKWPNDTLAIVTWYAALENLSPIMIPETLDNICARAGVPGQLVDGQMLTTSFLENGLDQTFMAINSDLGIHAKAITFVEESITLKGFFDIDFTPLPPPEVIIPGTIVLVSALATEDEQPSTRWSDTYLLKLDTSNYVWYGNQNEALNVQEAIKYGVYKYLEDFQTKGKITDATEMDNFYAIVEDPPVQTISNGLGLPNNFLESGLTQADEYAEEQDLYNVEVIFNFKTVNIKGFYGPLGDPIEDPPAPEDMISGTQVQVSIEATENGVPSSRFLNMFLMKIDSDEGNIYVWYGNQLSATP